MAKKTRKNQLPRKRANPDVMAAEIRTELRGILRRMDELRRPMKPELANDSADGVPSYVLRQMTAHEAIKEDVITLAGMVWHLKDRLNRWLSATNKTCVPSIEDIAAAEKPLLICGDLIDSKKHGGGCNRSGFAPEVGSISFKPDGEMGLRYDGALKLSDIRVSKPDPIPLNVEIVSGDGQYTFGSAVDLISKAFENWRRVIDVSDLLGGSDSESQELRRLLERFEKGLTPVFLSKLIG